MFTRSAVAAGLVLALVGFSPAQHSSVYTPAAPPDMAALDRLNLKTEWTVNLPMEGRRDAIALVQTVGDQLLVQTRTGLFGAIDAFTGKLQWWVQLGNGGYANVYPAAVNKDFVYVAHVTKLYCFYRYTGVVEFVNDLGTSPTTGLVADDSGLYAVLAIRPGAGGAHRVAVFDLPRPIGVANETVYNSGTPQVVTSVDRLASSYPTGGVVGAGGGGSGFGRSTGSLQFVPPGSSTGSRTPSLTVTPSVTPPYQLDVGARTPSLTTVPALRQPYRMFGENAHAVQRSPSISTIPPSVAAALALSDLRPRGVAPKDRWEVGTSERILYTPLLSPRRLWGASDGRMVVALAKDKVPEGQRQVQLQLTLPDQIAAAPAQAETTGYFPLSDGNLYAVDLQAGDQISGLSMLWRANVGGLMNHTPYVTDDAVYAAGDNSGVARIDRKTGELTWRSDAAADQVVAANKEFVYIRDRQGRFLVYAATRATDPANKRSVALSGINLAEFNLPVVNTASDRIILASASGLIVCLRDASPKYVRPMRISPPADVNSPPKANLVPGMRMGGDVPESKIDAKDPPKKDEPKKDEPKKDAKDDGKKDAIKS